MWFTASYRDKTFGSGLFSISFFLKFFFIPIGRLNFYWGKKCTPRRRLDHLRNFPLVQWDMRGSLAISLAMIQVLDASSVNRHVRAAALL